MRNFEVKIPLGLLERMIGRSNDVTIAAEEPAAPTRPPGSARSPCPAPPVLPERDVRRKRPPALSFLLRLETMRADRARGLAAAARPTRRDRGDLHRAGLKLLISDEFSSTPRVAATQAWVTFAYLVTVLMFARADLYADRPRRPGCRRIVTALFAGDPDLAGVRAGQRRALLELLPLLRLAVLRHRLHRRAAPAPHRVTGWLLEQAGYRRRGAARRLGQAHRGGRPRARRPRLTRRSTSSATSR